MFKRFLKTLAALAAGHGVQTFTQLLVPPVFIAAYGIRGYGEWLALSAAVGYLGTLDFGLQTYVLNELTGLYHRQQMGQFHRVQSVGLRLMLGFVGLGVLLAGSAFVLPVASILRIGGSVAEVAWTLFWLALQIVASIPLGQILGIYRTFGLAHHGVMWGNSYRTALLAVTLGLAFLRAPFWMIAFCQFLTAGLLIGLVLIWLKRSHPEICPRLDYWDEKLAGQILKPSAFFGLFMVNNFLVYQAPVLMLQRFLGSEAVVVFSVARTLFSFVRQGAGLVQQAIAPEVTRLNGLGDKERLVRLYLLFEAVVLATVLIINAGLLVSGPVLLRVWLKKPQLYDLNVFIPVMLVSILLSVKDYKIYFQYATNNHAKTGVVTFLSYILMIIASFAAIKCFGLAGFLTTWLAVELMQVGFIHFYNTQLFTGRREISLQPALKLGLALAALVVLVMSARSLLQSQHYFLQGVAAVALMAVLAGSSYFLFDLRPLVREGMGQLMKFRFG
jgi:O-antigen/teichoic acid export membrane protein